LVNKYSKYADFLTIYIEEAHPNDSWELPDATYAPNIKQPTTLTERIELAKCFASKFQDHPFGTLVVDTLDFYNNAAGAYAAWPERLYIIQNDVCLYKGGPGPFGYILKDIEDWLVKQYGE